MPFTTDQFLRRVTFRPYRKDMGPSFTLTLWDTYQARYDGTGAGWLGYRLTMRENGRTVKLFEGTDYGNSPLHAIDSDETVRGVMSFLTLRPGDTDREYFRDYTPRQMDYCAQHAEALFCAVDDRFGNDR